MKNLKPWFVTSGIFGGLGVVCFIVKLIEFTMREAHDWANVFEILGFVFLGIALLIVLVVYIIGASIEKKNADKVQISEEELLKQYKSKSKK